jgi:DNA-binding NarL/FixJ family response regulator
VTVPEPTRPLTRREREIFEHAALGMSNRQIAEQLSIAEQTVKNHLSSAMKKLSLHDRTQIVVFALGGALIDQPVGEVSEVESDILVAER